MAGVHVTFNQAALKSIALAGAAEDIKIRANRVLNVARSRAPVDKGGLRNSLHIEFATGPGGVTIARIGSNLPYAIYVHEGTGIYGPRHAMIYPKSGRFMVWPARNLSGSGTVQFKGGKTSAFVFATKTKGMPGRPFLVEALELAAP